MVDIEQKEIDDMLNMAMSGDNKEEEQKSSKKISSKDKIYKKPKKNVNSFKSIYISPVVKSDNVLYNPESNIIDIDNKIIVRSLDNYAEYVAR